MRLLFLGDVVGKPGRRAVRALLPKLIDRQQVDLVVANGENEADGAGLSPEGVQELQEAGVDVVTSGNHVWRRRESVDLLQRDSRVLRPANFPPQVPGRGSVVLETAAGIPVAVVSLMGRVFMDSLDCPFRAAETVLAEIGRRAHCVVVDMHAEATSEKAAMGWYLAGRVSAVLGSHTHVQTADERVLPGGTAFVTDVGMCGPLDSVIGMDRETALRRFLTQMPGRFAVATGPTLVQGVVVEIDADTGKAVSIERTQELYAP